MPITTLPEHTVRLLRSNLVIRTPLAIVKELVDNSVDAKATIIDILVSPNTVDKVEVRDNGEGIRSKDFEALGCPGHTSKIRSFEELQCLGGTTLGFRGEAMAAIRGIGEVTVTTRTHADIVATAFDLHLDGSGCRKLTRKSTPVGTSVTVTDIFKGFPVRKKVAMKEAGLTIAKIKQLLTAYALARPHLKLSFRELGSSRVSWSYSPRPGDALKEAVVNLFGPDLMASCVMRRKRLVVHSGKSHIRVATNESWFEVEAVIPRPDAELSKIARGNLLAVDSRPVSALRGTFRKILTSFRKFLAHSQDYSGQKTLREPFVCLDIKCSPGSYDVNLEPFKDNLMFADEQPLIDLCDGIFRDVYPSAAEHARLPLDEAVIDQQIDVPANSSSLHSGAGEDRLETHEGSASLPAASFIAQAPTSSTSSIVASVPAATNDGLTRPEPAVFTDIEDNSGEHPQPRQDQVVRDQRSNGGDGEAGTKPASQEALQWSVDMEAHDSSENESCSAPQPGRGRHAGSESPPMEAEKEVTRPMEGVNPWVIAKMNAPRRELQPDRSDLHRFLANGCIVPHVPEITPGQALRDQPVLEPGSRENHRSNQVASGLEPQHRQTLGLPDPVPCQAVVPGGAYRMPLPRGGSGGPAGLQRNTRRADPRQQGVRRAGPGSPTLSSSIETRRRGRLTKKATQGTIDHELNNFRARSPPITSQTAPGHQRMALRRHLDDSNTPEHLHAGEDYNQRQATLALPRMHFMAASHLREGEADHGNHNSLLVSDDGNVVTTVPIERNQAPSRGGKSSPARLETPITTPLTKMALKVEMERVEEDPRRYPMRSQRSQRNPSRLGQPRQFRRVKSLMLPLESRTGETLSLVKRQDYDMCKLLSLEAEMCGFDNYMLTGAIQEGLRTIRAGADERELEERIKMLVREELLNRSGEGFDLQIEVATTLAARSSV